MTNLWRSFTGVLLSLGIISGGHPRPADMRAGDTLPQAPPGYRWQETPDLSDEFNGPELDKAKWLPFQPYWQGREPSHFDPGNVATHEGKLELRSTSLVNDIAEVKHPNWDIWIHAACVASTTPRATYGYYEARVKASRLVMTSSFWFQGKYSEIDVVEEIGGLGKHFLQSDSMQMNTHYFPQGWSTDKSTYEAWKMPYAAADEFHVYGMWWKDKDTVWFYHDGKKVAELHPRGEFLEPMYLFFDTEVFTSEGLPTVESLKDPQQDTMSVDWVRAWKLEAIHN
jgi:beta-glucanase (GH16 family)